MNTGRKRSGFTLLELMTAMVILLVLVMLMAMVFNDADKMWYLGTGRALNCISGRAAMNLMTHDLEYAVADELLTFVVRKDKNNSSSYGFNHDEMCFVSFQNDSVDGNRTAREIFYYVKSTNKVSGTAKWSYGSLMRGYYSAAITNASKDDHCYYSKKWYDDAGRPGDSRPIVEYVTALRLFAPVNQNGDCGSVGPDTYNSTRTNIYTLYRYPIGTNVTMYISNSVPEYIDIYLEVLDESDAIKISEMEKNPDIVTLSSSAEGSIEKYIERNAKCYSTRVFFQNRLGNQKR